MRLSLLLLTLVMTGASSRLAPAADDVPSATLGGGQTASPRATTTRLSLDELLSSPGAAQRALLAYLQEKVGAITPRPISRPDLPLWAASRYRGAKNPKTLYALVQEDVYNALPLLMSRDEKSQTAALRVLHFAAIKSATVLKDARLCALLFDVMLPRRAAVSGAHGVLLTPQRLMQDAADAYRLTTQPDKQIAALRSLLELSEAEKNAARADWARIKLAEALAAQKQYDEAIALLKAVQSPNLKGSREWIPELEKQRALQSAQKK